MVERVSLVLVFEILRCIWIVYRLIGIGRLYSWTKVWSNL